MTHDIFLQVLISKKNEKKNKQFIKKILFFVQSKKNYFKYFIYLCWICYYFFRNFYSCNCFYFFSFFIYVADFLFCFKHTNKILIKEKKNLFKNQKSLNT
jgi:hypothetical protein